MYNNFVFRHADKSSVWGGCSESFEEMRRLPGKKALIATSNGQSTKKYGYLARVEKELELAGAEHELFDEIRPNPTRDNVMAGAQKAKETGCDFVVALGGGSVMDCSKCIALMMTNEGDIWDYSLSERVVRRMPEKMRRRSSASQHPQEPAVK
jgi:alcohol dehydrogenase